MMCAGQKLLDFGTAVIFCTVANSTPVITGAQGAYGEHIAGDN
jgi:hypothetical protein